MNTRMLSVTLLLGLVLGAEPGARWPGAASAGSSVLVLSGIALAVAESEAGAGREDDHLSRDTIREAQEQLQSAGFAPGPATGTLHDQTREALRKYQGVKGLPVSGELDPRTRTALRGETIRV